tara:strand:+ start:990 stop:2153 length:1164 start_codon:yes stop_codon:yes gene_type:complete
MSEELKQEVPVVDEVKAEEPKAVSVDDGVIKVDLGLLNKPETDAVPEQKADASDVPVEKPADAPSSEEVVEEVRDTIQVAESPIQEITKEEVAEKAEDLEEQVEQAIVEQNLGVKLPENIQKVVDFVNETGGSLEDFVKLNVDYDSLDEKQLLYEYYQASKPHLDREEVDFLMEDNFSYDEEIDEERDIRKKKIAKKEELSKAKKYLDEVKGKYYAEIKGGSKLLPEQKKAVEFFNRYTEENKEATKIAESQVSTFKAGTEKLFSNDFKGFDFNVGDKKFRYNVNNADQIKDTQSDINNFVKKFLNDKNEMSDAAGYHKSLFTAMNSDQIANHFYQQGKADAMKDSVTKAKNIDMDPRGTHEKVNATGGVTMRSIQSTSSKFGIKKR